MLHLVMPTSSLPMSTTRTIHIIICNHMDKSEIYWFGNDLERLMTLPGGQRVETAPRRVPSTALFGNMCTLGTIADKICVMAEN